MAEQRLIDANAIGAGMAIEWQRALVEAEVAHTPTINPEDLPIVQQLRKELAQVKAERDAAVEDLRGDCKKCANYKVTWNGCTPDFECPLSNDCLNRDMWEWRGLQKEE